MCPGAAWCLLAQQEGSFGVFDFNTLVLELTTGLTYPLARLSVPSTRLPVSLTRLSVPFTRFSVTLHVIISTLNLLNTLVLELTTGLSYQDRPHDPRMHGVGWPLDFGTDLYALTS